MSRRAGKLKLFVLPGGVLDAIVPRIGLTPRLGCSETLQFAKKDKHAHIRRSA